MYFDIEKALTMVGNQTLQLAIEKAKTEAAKQWLINSTIENEKWKNKTATGFPEISFCLENYYNYKTSGRRKRSFSYDIYAYKDSPNSSEKSPRDIMNSAASRSDTGLLVDDIILNTFTTRKLLSSNDPSFEQVENEILLNDPVSAAFGTSVCRYCLSKCPEN